MDQDTKQWHREQIDAYSREYPIYQAYAQFLYDILERGTRRIAPGAIIQVRAKAVASFAEKALRRADRLTDPVHELTDLCGTRVITVTPEQLEAVCDFIKEHFAVHEEGVDDVSKRLGTTEFGYRSVHFDVRLKGEDVLGIPIPKEIGNRVAEVQVRTLLQHSWADVVHDRLYKNTVKIPAPLFREAARLAAVLEVAEQTVTKLVNNVDAYVVNFGAYMSKQEMEDEIATLSTILENEPEEKNKPAIALRIAKMAKAAGNWEQIVHQLKPYEGTEQPDILRELGNALCQMNKTDSQSREYKAGQAYLERAVALNSSDAEAVLLLGDAWRAVRDEEEKAQRYYRKAFEIEPSNPYHLASFLEYEVFRERNSSILATMAPAIRAAIATCRAHADVKIELPWAFCTIGKLHLFLGEPYASLAAYCKALQICVAEESGISEWVFDQELESLRRLRRTRTALPGSDWERESLIDSIYRVLLLGKSIKFHPKAPIDELRDLAQVAYDPSKPVLLLSGGCVDWVESQMDSYRELLAESLERFDGTLFCGGTTAGISGVVGDLAAEFEAAGRKAFTAVAYHPRRLPARVELDRKNYVLHELDGKDFSALEPLQTWIDLIASGVRPQSVRVLGINGGPIAAFEYRLALALGAPVGIVRESGRAASEILDDKDWQEVSNIFSLPEDKMTIRAFVTPGRVAMSEEQLERAAQAVHAKYCSDNKHKLVDPSMVPWDKLEPPLKASNKAQAAYAEEILRAAGYGVRDVSTQDRPLPEFNDDEVELMAKMEHGRWNAERITTGWKPGPRDPLNKISPYLVPWKQLPEQVKEWDRDAVHNFPAMLREAGLEVYKLDKDDRPVLKTLP